MSHAKIGQSLTYISYVGIIYAIYTIYINNILYEYIT